MTDLGEAQAEALFSRIFAGALSEEEIADVLVGLHHKGETVSEIVGAARAAWNVRVPFVGPADAIDTCGTGGDGLNTFNVSTAVALAAAAMGITVIKHGNRASSSRCGSADVLEALGFMLDRDDWSTELAARRFAFLFAPTFHPSFRVVGAVRKRLGHRTIFNLLGPLINPAGVTRQVIGVFDEQWVEPMAHVLVALGRQRAMVVHGGIGVGPTDELAPWGTSVIATVAQGRVSMREVTLGDGVPEDSRGGDAATNAALIRAVLAGLGHATSQTLVALNLAAAMDVAGRGDFASNLPEARAFLLSGHAARFWKLSSV